jgi:small multidrug resistance pump
MISGALSGIIIGMSILELFAQIFIKTYYDTKQVYWFFLGWIFYFVVLYLLYLAYSFTGLAIANAAWSSFTLFLTTIVGIYYYEEELNFMQLLGIALIIVGIILIGIYTEEDVEEL